MFGSMTLLLLPLCADPVGVRFASTCGQPAARVVVASTHHAIAVADATDCREILTLLRGWERAAARVPEPSRARRDCLRHAVSSSVNGHAAIACRGLVGRIDALRLKTAFNWAISERRDGRVCLVATPRDETEQLFYRSLIVWMDEQAGCPSELLVCDRQGQSQHAWRFERPASPNPVQLVSLREEAPAPAEMDETEARAIEAACANIPVAR